MIPYTMGDWNFKFLSGVNETHLASCFQILVTKYPSKATSFIFLAQVEQSDRKLIHIFNSPLTLFAFCSTKNQKNIFKQKDTGTISISRFTTVTLGTCNCSLIYTQFKLLYTLSYHIMNQFANKPFYITEQVPMTTLRIKVLKF